VPELGAVISTFVMTPWLDAAALDHASAGQPAGSKYARAFVHPVLGVEKALYEWRGGSSGWSKSTGPLPPAERGPDFWEYRNDPDLLSDPEGWQKREVERFLAELRQAGEINPAGSVRGPGTSSPADKHRCWIRPKRVS
jgi:hypothetical protein